MMAYFDLVTKGNLLQHFIVKKIVIRTIWILIDFVVSFRKKNFFPYLNSGKSLYVEVYVYKLSFLSCLPPQLNLFFQLMEFFRIHENEKWYEQIGFFSCNWKHFITKFQYKFFLYPILYLYWISFTRKFQNKILWWKWFKDFIFFWNSIYINTLLIELIIIEIILLFILFLIFIIIEIYIIYHLNFIDILVDIMSLIIIINKFKYTIFKYNVILILSKYY